MPRTLTFWLALLLCSLSGLAVADAKARADAPLLVLADGSPQPLALGAQVQRLEDPRGILSLEDVLSPEWASEWQADAGELRSLGYTRSTWWFRLRLQYTGERDLHWLLSVATPDLRRLDVHVLDAQGRLQFHQQAGIDRPFHERLFAHRDFVFPLILPPGEIRELVWRVQTDGALVMPVFLQEQSVFAQREQRHLLLTGLLFGSLLVLLLYHAYHYLSAGGLRHLLLGCYIASLSLFLLSIKGLAYQFLWPGSIDLNQASIGLFAWLSILSGSAYLLEFFAVRRHYPRLLNGVVVLLGLVSLLYLGSLLGLAADFAAVLRGFHALAAVACFLLAARLWWRGNLAERYLGLSLMAMLATSLLYILYLGGYIDYSTWVVHAPDMGMALAAVALTLSLAEQIRQERIHQEMAFHRLLSQESELRAAREDALRQQERENQQLKRQVRTRDTELSLMTQHLKDSHDRFEDASEHDGLTGLPNLRFFRTALKKQCAMAARSGRAISVLLLDIDHFRAFNQQHGHVVGDEMLRVIAVLMSSVATRMSDTLARFGGEEFAILLPDTELEGAMVVAERIRRLVAGHELVVGEHVVQVTVSVGVASLLPEDGDDADMLLNQVRMALQKAKQQGRNQISFFEFPFAGPAEN